MKLVHLVGLVGWMLVAPLVWADTVVYYRKSDRMILGSNGSDLPVTAHPEQMGTEAEIGVIRVEHLPEVSVENQLVVNPDLTLGVQANPDVAQAKKARVDAIARIKLKLNLTDADVADLRRIGCTP